MTQQGMITMDNYEEYLYLEADGELNDAEKEMLQRFLEEHPGLSAELEELRSVRLLPDVTLSFEEKDSLLRATPRVRALGIPSAWKVMAAAASLGLLIWLGLGRFSGDKTFSAGNYVAEMVMQPAMQNRSQPLAVSNPANANDTIPTAQHGISRNPPFKTLKRKSRNERSESDARLARIETDLPSLRPSANIPKAMIAENAYPTALLPDGQENIPAIIYQPSSQTSNRLHFRLGNAAAINTLKEAANNTISRITHSPYHLHDVALNLKLGAKTFSINF